jgi:hypothetical protein
MGFPNVDLLLVDIVEAGFLSTQINPDRNIADVFSDLPVISRQKIVDYIISRRFVTDITRREDNTIYIMPNFVMTGLPFPQIGISLGTDTATEQFLGNETGNTSIVTMANGNDEIATEYAYYSTASWQIDIVAATKPEVVWLSRLCQLFILLQTYSLDEMGVSELTISLNDLKLEPEHYPSIVFARSISIHAKVYNSWLDYQPAITYQTGINTAVQGR